MNYIAEMRKHVGHDVVMTVGCGVLIENEKGEVLLQKRSDTGEWCVPGGSMTDRINDMELMKKILMFTRKNRPGMRGEGHGFHHGKGEPHFGRGPMPPFEGPHHGKRPPFEGPEPHCFKKPPLSREHLLVLIGEKPEGIRQKELIEKAGIGQSSVSELINKLEDDGYIERKVDPSDKRATLLFLTEKGQARALEVEDERNEFFSGIFSKLTEEEKQTLSYIMDKLLSE